jgi:hypothetical protein
MKEKILVNHIFLSVLFFYFKILFILDIFTGISEVDNNNNNHSKNLQTDEFLYNYETHMNIHELSHVIIAEQLTIIDAVCYKVIDYIKIDILCFLSGIIKTCFTS